MSELVTVEVRGHVLVIGINRPAKRNAWNREIIAAVATAYTRLRDEEALRAGVVFGHGDHFTGGLDLVDVLPVIAERGENAGIIEPDQVDPWNFLGEPCPKPVVIAAQGACYTLGIELILASEIAIVASDTVFAQAEVKRGIVPLGGGAPRLVTRCGVAGMKWLLTGERFTAEEALAAGLITEIVEPGTQRDRAIEVAETIAANAPLGVQASLAAARAAERAARDAGVACLREHAMGILKSADAMEGVRAWMQKRPPAFEGR